MSEQYGGYFGGGEILYKSFDGTDSAWLKEIEAFQFSRVI